MKTNFVLSLLTFITVLYSTFLTRSGVLGDTSVHSFVDPGMWVYWLLLGFIALFATIGFGLLFIRMKEMPKIPVEHSLLSREFALFLGAFALSFVALFVVIGTSSPIITSILKGKASAVEMMYYVKTNLPLGIAITFLSGLGQLLWWQHSKAGTILKSMAVPTGLALATTFLVLLMGSEEFLILLFTFCSAFSLFANLQVGYGVFMGNPKFVGGSIAHIGIAVMCLGFVTSERYDDKATVSLERDKSVEALGYQLTYVGYKALDRDRYAFNIEVAKGDVRRTVAPSMHFTEQSTLRHPDLVNFINKDFYVSPVSVEQPSKGEEQSLTLQKGGVAAVGNLKITFVDFDFNNFEKGAMLEGRNFVINVKLEVAEDGRKKPLTVQMRNDGAGNEFVPATYLAGDGSSYEFNLVRMMPDRDDRSRSKVEITVALPVDALTKQKGETLVIEASVKPMINLVCIGTVALVVGFCLTILRRGSEARLKSSSSVEE